MGNRQPLKSFDELTNKDLIISPIDNEVTEYLVAKNGDKYLTNGRCLYDICQFSPKDHYRYDGEKKVGEKDNQYFQTDEIQE